MSTRKKTHYEVLGIQPDAPDIVVRAAYRALAQAYHPDKASPDGKADATARMIEINVAFEVLSNPEARQAYDAEMTGKRSASSSAAAIELKSLKHAAWEGDYFACQRLAKCLAYEVKEQGGGFFSTAKVVVRKGTFFSVFDTPAEFVRWTQSELC